ACKRSHIRPRGSLMRWLPQQERRMEHCKRLDLSTSLTWKREPRAPRAQNPPLDAQEGASRRCPKTNQVFRIGKINLTLNERQAGLCFLRGRRPIAWGSPRNYIRDINILSI